jgi:NADPH-dependent 2,4-dienoyl-CoA reductase/sulfur reductase-like enzyme
MEHVVVVGAGLAGWRAAEALRREGHTGRLTLVGGERHVPYDRPPLSKDVLRGETRPEAVALAGRDAIAAVVDDLRLGQPAVALRAAERTVVLGDGTELVADGIVLATGATPRRLPGTEGVEGIFVLRTLDDAVGLRAALGGARRVVVVGAGFIGAEVAASCRALGLEVDLVEALPAPLPPGLGPLVGEACAQLHRDRGVTLHLGVGVRSIEGGGADARSGRVERVVLVDGTVLEADVVVVGIGVRPESAWLEGSGLLVGDGLQVGDGVLCDPTCAALTEDGAVADGIVVAGDLCRWTNPLFEESMRVEHWDNAVEQAEAAARRLVHGPDAPPYAPVPYFWSDQYDTKIQFAGRAGVGDDLAVVHGAVADGKWVGIYGRADRLVGVVAFSWPRHVVRYRRLIAERASFAEAVAAVV